MSSHPPGPPPPFASPPGPDRVSGFPLEGEHSVRPPADLPWFPNRIPAGVTVGAGAATWLVASLASVGAMLAFQRGDVDQEVSSWAIIASLVALWGALLGGVVVVSRRWGSGQMRRDFGLGVRPVDLWGLPVGVFAQVPINWILYVVLMKVLPDVFTEDRLAGQTDALLTDRSGVGFGVLVVCVAVGAPIVEEIFYRGFLQRSLSRPLGRAGALVVVSMVFALIHFFAVGIPGLFLAAIIFGMGVFVTGRIGFGIFAHIGYNSTALALFFLVS